MAEGKKEVRKSKALVKGESRGASGTRDGKKSKPVLAPTEADYKKSLEDGMQEGGTIDVLAFLLARTLYALEIEYVEEVIKYREVTTLPRTPDFIEGVVSLRGEMLMVMNLKRRLRLSTKKSSSIDERIVVVELDGVKCGLRVDALRGIIVLPAKLADVEEGVRGFDFITGRAGTGEKAVEVLNVRGLLDFEVLMQGAQGG